MSEYFIGFVLGVAAAIVVFLLRRAVVAGAPSGKPAAPPADGDPRETPRADAGSAQVGDRQLTSVTEVARLYSVVDDLAYFFEHSAQPSELVGNPAFERGVAILAGDSFSSQQLLAYFAGDNQIVACIALEALGGRRDDVDIVEPILRSINNVGYWSRYFALKTLDRRVDEALLARVLSRLDESWETPMLSLVLKEFVAQRLSKEPKPSGEEFRNLSRDELETLGDLLGSLGNDVADKLAREIEEWRKARTDTDVLSSIGRVWSEPSDGDVELVVELESHRASVARLESSLLKEPPRSILLVGEAGSGKTSLLRLLGRRLVAAGWTVFEAGATEIMAGQSYIGELENRVKELVEQIGGRKKVLWVVPALHNLLWAGRHRYSPTGVLDLFLPFIEGGEVVVAGEVAQESYEVLTKSIPRIRAAFDTYVVEVASDGETLELARAWIERRAARSGWIVDESASPELLGEALQLAKQYLGGQASPGNLLGLVKRTVERLAVALPSGEPLRLGAADLIATLSQLTGLPRSILDDREKLELDALRQHLGKRVLGQPEAVECVVERVAMIKAGLTDPTRPQGVFLFAGPTGTGKTEIAKTLSEFLFGSEGKMIRLDMSEYQTPDSIGRILGDDEEHSQGTALVHQVRHQPFSVILLDEFEKAAPAIWDLFLQMFDDGRLTDKRGNTADFRHAIIILTTNLGGDISRGAGIGFSDPDLSTPRAVQKAVSEVFRKEFINRIDRVVAFRPLDRSTMREILYKELDLVLKRRGLRSRSWAVEWEDSAIEFLLAKGFDATLGARPLKRAVERYLLSPLALTIVNHQFPGGDQFLFVRSDGERIVVEFIDPDVPDEPDGAVSVPDSAAAEEGRELSLRGIALEARGSRAELEFLRRRYDALHGEVDAESWKAQKADYLARLSSEGFWESPERFSILGLAEYMDRIEAGLDTAGSLIRRLSEVSPRSDKKLSRHLMRRLGEQVYLLGEACAGLRNVRPRDAFLRVRAVRDSGGAEAADSFATTVGRMYRGWATRRRMELRVLREEPGNERRPYSLLLSVSGYAAFTILEGEAGLHVLELPGKGRQLTRVRARVQVVAQPDAPPLHGEKEFLEQALGVLHEAPGDSKKVVRTYREKPSPLVRDAVKGWRTGRLSRVLEGDFDLVT
ncbi:MAG: AAA family ATPase [Planctomycetota bacterium]|nr:AAA family ATPase [Planctomycetota bacterium]